jgi:hypothetical protein
MTRVSRFQSVATPARLASPYSIEVTAMVVNANFMILVSRRVNMPMIREYRVAPTL